MKKETLLIRFLYRTPVGRGLLKAAIQPGISQKAGCFLNSKLSRWLVPIFVKKYKINLEEYEKQNYDSFNDFFTRKRYEGRIDITPGHLISPCDGYLSVYPIDENRSYRIKHIEYHLEQLLDSRELAEHFAGGWCMIFRLAPQNYHRYCYVCNGIQKVSRKINGKLHSVRPAAYTSVPVFMENSREYVEIESDTLGRMVQMEIGALLVGRIHNHFRDGNVLQGEEKGYFEFGGSTIMILLERNRVRIREAIRKSSRKNEETEVHMGEMVGSIQKERRKSGYE